MVAVRMSGITKEITSISWDINISVVQFQKALDGLGLLVQGHLGLLQTGSSRDTWGEHLQYLGKGPS